MPYTLGIPDISSGYLQTQLQREREAAESARAMAALDQRQREALAAGYREQLRLRQAGAIAADQGARADRAQALAEAEQAGKSEYYGRKLVQDQAYQDALLAEKQREAQPFTPDPAAAASLRAAGYLYAPQSDRGGTFLPVKSASSGPALGTTTDLGDGYRGVITGPDKMTVVKPQAAKANPLEAARQQATKAKLADYDAQIAEHAAKIAAGDNRHGLFNLFSREQSVKDLQSLRTKEAAALQSSLPTEGPAASSAHAIPGSTVGPAPAGAGAGAPPAAPAVGVGAVVARPLDRATAQRFLQEAGGDTATARAMALRMGYTF